MAIINGVEYLLAIVAALRHVVRQSWNDDASTSGLDQKLAETACTLIENASVPFYPRPFSPRPLLPPDEARQAGFESVPFIGDRSAAVGSANPGRAVDFTRTLK